MKKLSLLALILGFALSAAAQYEMTIWSANNQPITYATSDVDSVTFVIRDLTPVMGPFYITGNDALLSENVWQADAIQMTQEGGVVTHTFRSVPAGSYCQFKITIGDWIQNWGYDAVQNRPSGIYGDADGNVVFTMASTSDVKVSFDGEKITVTGDFVISSTPTPETTTYYIGGNTPLIGNENWAPNAITMTKDGNNYTYTFQNVPANQECKFKITNGSWDRSWGFDELSTVPAGVTRSNSNNIVFKLATTGNVSVSFDGQYITINGNFRR